MIETMQQLHYESPEAVSKELDAVLSEFPVLHAEMGVSRSGTTAVLLRGRGSGYVVIPQEYPRVPLEGVVNGMMQPLRSLRAAALFISTASPQPPPVPPKPSAPLSQGSQSPLSRSQQSPQAVPQRPQSMRQSSGSPLHSNPPERPRRETPALPPKAPIKSAPPRPPKQSATPSDLSESRSQGAWTSSTHNSIPIEQGAYNPFGPLFTSNTGSSIQGGFGPDAPAPRNIDFTDSANLTGNIYNHSSSLHLTGMRWPQGPSGPFPSHVAAPTPAPGPRPAEPSPPVDLMNSVTVSAESAERRAALQALENKLNDFAIEEPSEDLGLDELEQKLLIMRADLYGRKQQHEINIRELDIATTAAKDIRCRADSLLVPPELDDLVAVRDRPLEEAKAADRAISDLLQLLSKALDAGSIELHLFLRLVRQYSREQFGHRCLLQMPPDRPPKA